MGFGGVKQSGTGWKEAGLEALDVYSDEYVDLVADPAQDMTGDGCRARPGRGRRCARGAPRPRRSG